MCTLIQYMGFTGIIFMLSWMFQHDYLDTCCFECLIYACVLHFCIHTCSAQLSMFHMERHSRNTLIIIIITIIKADVLQSENRANESQWHSPIPLIFIVSCL